MLMYTVCLLFFVCMHVCMYMYVCMCVCLIMCMHVCLYVYMYVYVCTSPCLSFCRSVLLSFCLSVCPVCLSCLSVLSVCHCPVRLSRPVPSRPVLSVCSSFCSSFRDMYLLLLCDVHCVRCSCRKLYGHGLCDMCVCMSAFASRASGALSTIELSSQPAALKCCYVHAALLREGSRPHLCHARTGLQPLACDYLPKLGRCDQTNITSFTSLQDVCTEGPRKRLFPQAPRVEWVDLQIFPHAFKNCRCEACMSWVGAGEARGAQQAALLVAASLAKQTCQ